MGNKGTRHIPLDERDPATVRAVIRARVSDPGAKDITVESQIDECRRFIRRMGWLDCGAYSDKASGYLDVRLAGLEEIERLIQRREVDVVVCLNWERLARNVERRSAALYFARKYGCEYRFAELLPDGKRLDTPEAKAHAALMEVFGEMEREKIIARTTRGRLKRLSQGLPSGGRGGAPYGFRRALEGEVCTAWMDEPREHTVLRQLFERVDSDETANAHSLMRELNAAGITTREGNQWSPATVAEKLSNPAYCGRARLNRWKVEWERRTYDDGTTEQVRTVRLRAADDPDGYLPVAAGTMPVLIAPELFDRVQTKLTERAALSGRVDRESSPHPLDATLLDGRYVRCAHCGHLMAREWRADTGRTRETPVPYYRCSSAASNPAAGCQTHMTPAPGVDALVLRLLAHVLTDPEQIIALADAATTRHADAVATSEIAGAKLEGYGERRKAIATDLHRLVGKLRLSDPTNEDDAEDIARYRERIARLESEQGAIDVQMAQLAPERDRALDRQAFLRRLFTARAEWINFETGERGATGPATLRIRRDLLLHQAAALLGVRGEEDVTLPREQVRIVYDQDDPASEVEEFETVATLDVVLHLLAHAGRERVRALLRDLEVWVEISRPRSAAERALHGRTPVEERVVVCVPSATGTLRITWPVVAGSADVANGTQLAMPTMSTPAAQISGYVVTAASTMNPP